MPEEMDILDQIEAMETSAAIPLIDGVKIEETKDTESNSTLDAAASVPTPPKFEIISALYGTDEDGRVEITVKEGRKLTNKLAGCDPVPKKLKNVIIKALYGGKEIEYTFKENEVIKF
jgi:hypothetical protein